MTLRTGSRRRRIGVSLVKAEPPSVEPLAAAKILKGLSEEAPGRHPRRGDRRTTPTTKLMLAALTGLAQGTFASKVEVVVGDTAAGDPVILTAVSQTVCRSRCRRDVTTDLRLTSRAATASLPNIMRRRRRS